MIDKKSLNRCFGIITFHRASNYGAVLQAYALQYALKSMGVNAPIVDYRTPQVEFDHRPQFSMRKNGLLRGGKQLQAKLRKACLFDAFRARALDMTEQYSEGDLVKVAQGFDGFVVGSDQVWSEVFGGLDPNLFLTFLAPQKRWSYACSFGTSSPSVALKAMCETQLPLFRGVSLRESSGCHFVEERLGIEARTDIDPVLLLSANDWDTFSDRPTEDGYILVYTVQAPVCLLDEARLLSERTGKKVIYLNNGYLSHRDLKHVRYTTPERFVGMFKNADTVMTNSFHGTAFGIVFNKELFVEGTTVRGVNNRSLELLDACGLSDRAFEGSLLSSKCEPIDWHACREHLRSFRESSLSYLSSMVNRSGEVRDE